MWRLLRRVATLLCKSPPFNQIYPVAKFWISFTKNLNILLLTFLSYWFVGFFVWQCSYIRYARPVKNWGRNNGGRICPVWYSGGAWQHFITFWRKISTEEFGGCSIDTWSCSSLVIWWPWTLASGIWGCLLRTHGLSFVLISWHHFILRKGQNNVLVECFGMRIPWHCSCLLEASSQ